MSRVNGDKMERKITQFSDIGDISNTSPYSINHGHMTDADLGSGLIAT